MGVFGVGWLILFKELVVMVDEVKQGCDLDGESFVMIEGMQDLVSY